MYGVCVWYFLSDFWKFEVDKNWTVLFLVLFVDNFPGFVDHFFGDVGIDIGRNFNIGMT